MRLVSLALRQFRNFEKFEFEPSAEVTLLRGPNGAGKTSVLEAISFTALLKSFRTTRPQELIRSETDALNIRARVETDRRETPEEIFIGLDRSGRKVKVNGEGIVRFRDFYGRLRAVVFSPTDMELLFREPALRREWLDRILLQVEPMAHDMFLRFQKTLRNRNNLLKQPTAAPRDRVLDAWEEKFVEYGAEITRRRANLVMKLSRHVAEIMPRLLPEAGQIRTEYRHDLDSPGENFSDAASALRERMKSVREQEFERGHALAGPHLHDLVVTGQEGDIRRYFSRGQVRQLMLALALAEARFIAGETREMPVLLLDDIFSELDADKIEIAAAELAGLGQVIVTSCQGSLPASLSEKSLKVIDL